VNAVLMMIGDVIANESAQMGCTQRNDVIQKFPAAASDPAFSDSILPGRLDSGPLYFKPVAFSKSATSRSNFESWSRMT